MHISKIHSSSFFDSIKLKAEYDPNNLNKYKLN